MFSNQSSVAADAPRGLARCMHISWHLRHHLIQQHDRLTQVIPTSRVGRKVFGIMRTYSKLRCPQDELPSLDIRISEQLYSSLHLWPPQIRIASNIFPLNECGQLPQSQAHPNAMPNVRTSKQERCLTRRVLNIWVPWNAGREKC